jgi:hypothetical protein
MLVAVVTAALSVAGARAEVFHSRESALRLAFPEADSVASRSLMLSDQQAERIEEISRTRLDARVVRLYTGLRAGEVLGYAFIETHRVRSLPETILVVLDPEGRSRAVHLLAFHEPPEYLPSERWLGQFQDRELDDELALRRGVAGIAGSTLTATAITAAVRRLLAIHEVCVAPSQPARDTASRARAESADVAGSNP